ncbi:MAG: HK97 family phage prohead protease [Pseudomonadota bacterium]
MIPANRAEIEGYAAVFGQTDLTGDRILPGAFRPELIPTTDNQIRMLYQHKVEKPIGRWTDIREDSRGLLVRGQLFLDIKDGEQVYRLVRGGALDGLSIGFKTRRAKSTRQGGRMLMAIDLWEVSIVTFPMSPSARIARVSEAGERLPRNLLSS